MKTTTPLCLLATLFLVLTGCSTVAENAYRQAVIDRRINNDPASSLQLALQEPESAERLITEAKTIPAEIGTLTNLKTLHLGRDSWGGVDHPLTTLPPEIGQLTNLETLSIYQAPGLKHLPKEIGNLKNLKRLKIKGVWHRGTGGELVGVTPGYHFERRGQALFPLGLQDLPEEFGQLTNLENLILYNTEVQTLPDSIGNLKKLNFFFCAHGDLRVIPPEIGGCKSLEFMNMPDNPMLGNFPPEIGNCKNLRAIWSNLNTARTAIPKEIGKLQQLAFLELGGSGLKIVPAELGNCSRLHSLNLGGGAYTELPPELGNLKSLAHLALKGSSLSSIPPEWGKLHRLTQMDISRTKISELPAKLGNLHNLRFLDLRGTKIESLPVSFQGLEKLEFVAADQPLADKVKALLPQVQVDVAAPADPLYRIPLLLFRNAVERGIQTGRSRTTPNNKAFTLDWQNRGLASVEIRKPERVSEIKLNGNRLTQIPSFILKAKSLKQINLSGNPIPAEAIRDLQQKRPELKIVLNSPAPTTPANHDFSKACYAGIELSFADPASVQHLKLDYNEFAQFPAFLSKMVNLETLDLDVNMITALPDSIGKFTRLRTLSLSANLIERLSPEIGLLQHLETLDLSINSLSTLPDEMAALKNLKELDLSGNELEILPEVLFQLENLETLDLRGNPLPADKIEPLQKALPSTVIKI